MCECTCKKDSVLVPPDSARDIILKLRCGGSRAILAGYYNALSERYKALIPSFDGYGRTVTEVPSAWTVEDWYELSSLTKPIEVKAEEPPAIKLLTREEGGLDWHDANIVIPNNIRNVFVETTDGIRQAGWYGHMIKGWRCRNSNHIKVKRWKEI